MAEKKLWIRRETLVGIADAIRRKKGIRGEILVADFESEILSIVESDSSWCGEYQGGNYLTGAIVSYNGNVYLCIKDTDDEQEPTDTEYWQMLNEEGEAIPEYTEVEDFTVFLDEPDEGTLTVAYSTPQDVKLPVPSVGSASRLASVDDENFKVNNIKKGVSIFGLVGAYEGEVIPEISEVEAFTLYAGTADEGSLEIGYDASERVALPEGSHLLASIEDANYIPSNIKKGANIFGLEGEYEGETDSPLPIEVSTEAEMTALLTSGEIGGVYKYTGATGTYENGAYYVLEKA